MNIEPLVSYAAKLMKAAANTGAINLHLCYYGKKLQCLATNHTIHRHVILFTFTNEQWRKGFGLQDWNQIRREMSKLTKELELCLTQLKT